MCKSQAEGGDRCEYADMVANVRKKARYKYRDSYDRERKAEDAVNNWKEAHPEIVTQHLPERMPFNYTPKDTPISKELLAMLTSSSRTPVTGSTSPEERLQAVIDNHDAYKEWESRLTLDEQRAVGAYTLSAFEMMNAILRKKGFTHRLKQDHAYGSGKHFAAVENRKRITEVTKDRITHLKSAFKKSVPMTEPRKLYRFFRVPAGVTPSEYIERYLQTGEGFSDPAFMSTTSDPEFIMAHMHDRNKGTKNKGYVVMEILTKQGQSVQPQPYTMAGNVQSLENEVLLPPSTKLRVAGINKVQRFEYGSDRKDLYKQYNMSHYDSHYMFQQYGHHSKGDRLNFPMVQLIDEKLIREYERKEKVK